MTNYQAFEYGFLSAIVLFVVAGLVFFAGFKAGREEARR